MSTGGRAQAVYNTYGVKPGVYSVGNPEFPGIGAHAPILREIKPTQAVGAAQDFGSSSIKFEVRPVGHFMSELWVNFILEKTDLIAVDADPSAGTNITQATNDPYNCLFSHAPAAAGGALTLANGASTSYEALHDHLGEWLISSIVFSQDQNRKYTIRSEELLLHGLTTYTDERFLQHERQVNGGAVAKSHADLIAWDWVSAPSDVRSCAYELNGCPRGVYSSLRSTALGVRTDQTGFLSNRPAGAQNLSLWVQIPYWGSASMSNAWPIGSMAAGSTLDIEINFRAAAAALKMSSRSVAQSSTFKIIKPKLFAQFIDVQDSYAQQVKNQIIQNGMSFLMPDNHTYTFTGLGGTSKITVPLGTKLRALTQALFVILRTPQQTTGESFAQVYASGSAVAITTTPKWYRGFDFDLYADAAGNTNYSAGQVVPQLQSAALKVGDNIYGSSAPMTRDQMLTVFQTHFGPEISEWVGRQDVQVQSGYNIYMIPTSMNAGDRLTPTGAVNTAALPDLTLDLEFLNATPANLEVTIVTFDMNIMTMSRDGLAFQQLEN
jgi:hypothetical protein